MAAAAAEEEEEVVTVEARGPDGTSSIASTIGGGRLDVFRTVSSFIIGSGKGSGVNNGDGSSSDGWRSRLPLA